MSDHTTISLRREFVEDDKEYIEDEPFSSVKELVKDVVVRETGSEGAISGAKARQIGRKPQELGSVE